MSTTVADLASALRAYGGGDKINFVADAIAKTAPAAVEDLVLRSARDESGKVHACWWFPDDLGYRSLCEEHGVATVDGIWDLIGGPSVDIPEGYVLVPVDDAPTCVGCVLAAADEADMADSRQNAAQEFLTVAMWTALGESRVPSRFVLYDEAHRPQSPVDGLDAAILDG